MFIKQLTPEQKALMLRTRDEWIKIGLDTSPVDKQKAEEAITLAYKCAGLNSPQKILWFDNPKTAMTWIVSTQDPIGRYLRHTLWYEFKEVVNCTINAVVDSTVRDTVKQHVLGHVDDLLGEVHGDIFSAIWGDLQDLMPMIAEQVSKIIVDGVYDYTQDEDDAFGVTDAGELAFYAYFHAIGVDCSKLRGLWASAKYCGWWWAYEEVAIVTPKPRTIHLDADGRLHAEGEPAIAYEGFNIYAYDRVRLPEKYGQMHPYQWQSQWLLEEDNIELRRVLIQGIGYNRILEELQAVELDAWQEYTLLKIDADADIEPIILLKMICPSTGHIHALRVPPDMKSAREAICWVNWGIDPEEFSAQS